jgi:hypothetical protein
MGVIQELETAATKNAGLDHKSGIIIGGLSLKN